MIKLALQLYWEFFKIGLFSVGGGLATLPFLEELMHKTQWFTPQDLSNVIALSECTPGPLGVNMATYVGTLVLGPGGGVVSTLGLVTPSIVVIILIAIFLKNFSQLPVVQNVFKGLRPASTALIAVACCTVAKASIIDISLWTGITSILAIFKWERVLLAVIIFFAMKKFKWHPVVYIAIAAVVGIIFKF